LQRGYSDQQYGVAFTPLSVFGVFGMAITGYNPFMSKTWLN